MNSQVLIDRELLERIKDCAEAYIDIDDDDCAAIQKLLATPAPIPDAGEVVEVVGHILIGGVTDGEMDDNDLDFSSRMLEEIQARCVTPDQQSLPVMLVSQHTRIVSALQASAMVVPDGYKVAAWCMTDFPANVTVSPEVCASWHRQLFNVSPLYLLAASPPAKGGE